jgi:hypothetical protein
MSMTTLAPHSEVPLDLRRESLSPRRRIVDGVMKVLMWVSVIVAAIPLGAVTYYVIVKGVGDHELGLPVRAPGFRASRMRPVAAWGRPSSERYSQLASPP